MATLTAALSDRLSLRALAIPARAKTAVVTVGLFLRPAVATRYRAGAALSDGVRVKGVVATRGTFHLTMRERTLRIRGAFAVGLTAHLVGRLALHPSIVATDKVRLRERLALGLRQQTAFSFRVAMASALRLHAGTQVALGALLRDTLHVSGRLTQLYAAMAAVTDQVVVHQGQGVQLRIVVIEREGVTVTQADVERMILRGVLDDQLALVAGFYDPGGDVTTWAINARTGAVSEYTGYGFSSFAKFGPGYVATTDKGLYELAGDTDAGEPIVADMISGLLEMTGSNLTSLKAVYLAIRGQGEMFLKLTTGEGRSSTYRVLTRSLHTARVDVGKGWRARYFNYQLVTTGQDFDLQGLEFLPVASVRRV